VYDLKFQLDRWRREHPTQRRSYRSRRASSTIRDVGVALGPWDEDIGSDDDYDSDDSFIAPEFSDDEDLTLGADTGSESAATTEDDSESSAQSNSSTEEESAAYTEQDSDHPETPPDTPYKRLLSDSESDVETVLSSPRKRTRSRWVTSVSGSSDFDPSDPEFEDISKIRKKMKSREPLPLGRVLFPEYLSPINSQSSSAGSSPPRKSDRKRQPLSDPEDDIPIVQLYSQRKTPSSSCSPRRRVRTYIGKPPS